MVEVRFINDTTPIEVTSETQETEIEVTSETQETEIEVGGLAHADLSGRDLPDQHPVSAITGLQEALLEKQDVLTAGENIQIENGVISATDTTYTAGTGISIENGVISNTQTSAEWGNIGGDITAQTDLQNALNLKANVSDIPTKTSDLTNDSGFITNSALVGYATESYVDTGLNGKQDKLTQAQLDAVNSGANTTNIGQISTNTSGIADINALIPNQATSSNQLADKSFVNSSINNMAAFYITSDVAGDPFATRAALIAGPYYFRGEIRTPTQNDYALVSEDETHDDLTSRYMYDGGQWVWQYTLNNTKFTQAQIDAINSGITDGLVAKITTNETTINNHIADKTNPHEVTKAQVGLSNVDNTSDLNKPISTATQTALNSKQDTISDLATIRSGAALGATAVQPSDLATVATSGNYNDLSNKPIIPAAQVNADWNATSGVARILNKPIIPTVPTNVSAFTNDAGYITSSALSGYATENYVDNVLDAKQDNLTAGTDLEIVTESGETITVSGNGSVTLNNAEANSLNYVKLFGTCIQNSTPTPTNPVDIICNNGTLTLDSATQQIIAVGTTETVRDSLNNTAIAQNLLSIWDAEDESIVYKDEQDILTGNITRRVGYYVLTGEETFYYLSSEHLFYSSSSLKNENPLGAVNCLCNYYRGKKTSKNRQVGDCYILASGRLDFLDDRFNSTVSFKSWLAEKYAEGDPVIVIFPLETPTTETVPSQVLNTTEGTNTLSIVQSSIPNLGMEVNYNEKGKDIINFTNDSRYITSSALTPYALSSSLATVATSGSYNDLSNKPTIPTVNNPTITFTQGGTTKGTITLNQSSNQTIAFDAGGGSGSSYTAGTGIDITNDIISVTAPTLINSTTDTSTGVTKSLYIQNAKGLTTVSDKIYALVVGSANTNPGNHGTIVGISANCISTSATNSVALGCGQRTNASYAIQIGGRYLATNSDANTFKVSNANGNFEMMDANGKIPSGRLPIATSVSSSSTNDETVGAKLFYDTCGDIETLINAL